MLNDPAGTVSVNDPVSLFCGGAGNSAGTVPVCDIAAVFCSGTGNSAGTVSVNGPVSLFCGGAGNSAGTVPVGDSVVLRSITCSVHPVDLTGEEQSGKENDASGGKNDFFPHDRKTP